LVTADLPSAFIRYRHRAVRLHLLPSMSLLLSSVGSWNLADFLLML
jgi:hypothetical protein